MAYYLTLTEKLYWVILDTLLNPALACSTITPMNSYFLTLVLNPNQEEKERKELLDIVRGKVEREKGKVTKEDLWGARDLAYPIRHLTKGFYAHFEFSAEPDLAKDLDKTLRVEEDILRYLLVRAKVQREEGKVNSQKEKVEEEETEEPVKKMMRKKKIRTS